MTLALDQTLFHQTGVGLSVPFAVAGTGMHLPPAVVTNQDLTRTLDTSDEWITSRTGIRERRRLAPHLATSDMCVAAARPALDAAGTEASRLDAVIVATYTGDQPLVSTALIVKDALGAHRALALDVTQAACASGIQAMLIAAHLLQNPSITTVLLLAADCASRVADPADRTTGVFFGDAAAAAVLARTDTPGAGLLSYSLGSQLSYDVQIPAGGSRRPAGPDTVAAGDHYLSMDGRAVWDTATTRLPESIAGAAHRAGVPVDRIRHFFLHQANLNIISETMAALDVPRDRAPVTIDRLGNTGSAGLFTALHTTHTEGGLLPGDTYVLSGIGAGFQWGTLCLRHA
ncbi:putative 3-oxoacyl-(acyl carrier protein) synthase III [Actinacidiphila reveromycinica]|uniref:Putative 3-oxoacyl-(Acyl carrier protein) synthase III n=1 Tax=Actinacidiphila reveromycinica TaxID=659352 RepID=A0A7U3VLF1_9ACTN|nr:ketoacyl-ACP synthase III [Streptomyces sp. SN-593]BBA95469.1 putative 3-oxoacyl-(acyl carrier protein) synthase III [Streptomyces sp. SN-593]